MVKLPLGLLDRCPGCGAPVYEVARFTGNNYVCSRCGTVLNEIIMDYGPEWRTYNPEDAARRSRVGSPNTFRLHVPVGTIIDKRRTSRGGVRKLTLGERSRMEKLAATQQKVIMHGSNERLANILREVNRAGSELRLPNHVIESASFLVRELFKRGIIKRNNVEEYVAASLVAAIKLNAHPLSMSDVVKKLGVSRQALWRAYSNLVEKLKVNRSYGPRSIPKPQMYISRIASKLKLNGEVESLAYRFSYLLVKTGIAQGKPPEALAAAAVYVASILLDDKRNQVTIARAVGVTDATIRNRYRDIVDNFYIEVRI